MQYQPPTGSIPDAPGSYQFYDAEGRVLYVGKAKSLRHRLPNYWQDSAKLLPRTAQMVAQADHVEWVVVESEVDALILEHSLIQAHLPRYNVRLKDDKSYPWLAVTLDDEWPRPAVVRGRKRKGVRYFGPTATPGPSGPPSTSWCGASRSARARTPSSSATSASAGPACSTTSSAARGPASTPSTTRPTTATSRTSWASSPGTPSPVLDRLEAEMQDASDAPRVRAGRPPARPHRGGPQGGRVPADGVRAARGLRRDRHRRGPARGVGADLPRPPGPGGRPPRLRGREGGGPQRARVHGAGAGARSTAPSGPRCPAGCWSPSSRPTSTCSAAGCAPCARARSTSRSRKRGAKRALQETVTRSAAEDLARHRLRRASDHNARSKALTELQAALGLREAPLRIECFDMSHLQGTDYVGSMVVLEDGLVKRSDYRRFKVKTVQGQRRLRRHGGGPDPPPDRAQGADADRPELGVRARPRRFAYRPNLLVVDGGKGQLGRGRAGGQRARPGRRDRAGVPGQAVRGGLPPRLARTRPPAAWVRCPLPPPAGPGRGPPVRHHLPPREAGRSA